MMTTRRAKPLVRPAIQPQAIADFARHGDLSLSGQGCGVGHGFAFPEIITNTKP